MSSKPALIVLAFISFAGCVKKAEAPPPRYAVLRFENLSGDSSLDWVGRAASEVLSRDLAGQMDGPVVPARAIGRLGPTLGARPQSSPGDSSERFAAILAGASRLLTGTLSKTEGGLALTAFEEDTTTAKTIGVFKGSGKTPLDAIRRLVPELTHRPLDASNAFPTSNNEALQVYTTAIESPRPEAIPLLQKVVAMDPGFGPAWASLAGELGARGDRAGAEQALAKANTMPLRARDRAQLELEAANLAGGRKRLLAAMQKVADFNPGDLLLQRSLAEGETAIGNDQAAAAIWKRITSLNPTDGEAWNNYAYALAYRGDSAGALAAIQHYVDQHPNEANPLDSKGDIQYLFRQFGEAAKSYSAAYAKQPAALDGGEPYKTAWAKFRAGDLAEADNAFAQFRAEAIRRKSAALPLLVADWYYRTSRKQKGLDSLEQSIPAADAPAKSLMAAQVAVWYVMEGKREKAYRVITSVPLVREFPVIAAFFVARPSASVSEWQALADRMLPAAGNSPLMHDTVLAYALILDHHISAAMPIWNKLMEQQTTPDPFMRAVALRLQGKPLDRPLIPNPLQYNEFTAVLDSL